MKMEQPASEIKPDALTSETLERIEVAANCQIELCIAARLILDRAEVEPDLSLIALALQGVISAIAARAKEVLLEVEVEYSEEALKCLHS